MTLAPMMLSEHSAVAHTDGMSFALFPILVSDIFKLLATITSRCSRYLLSILHELDQEGSASALGWQVPVMPNQKVVCTFHSPGHTSKHALVLQSSLD